MKIRDKMYLYFNLLLIFLFFFSIFCSFVFPMVTINGLNITVTLLSSIVCFLTGIAFLFKIEKNREAVFDAATRSKSKLLILWAKSLGPEYEVMYQVGGGIAILISFYLFGIFFSALFLYLS